MRALADERDFLRGAVRILLASCAPEVKGSAPLVVPPEGIIRTFSRRAKDAARVEGSYLRVFDT